MTGEQTYSTAALLSIDSTTKLVQMTVMKSYCECEARSGSLQPEIMIRVAGRVLVALTMKNGFA
jgi:hypothetical protein